eukprot:SAG11_NODE_16430_length_547_cov_1.720982_1_plen_57_part_10
MDLRPPPAAAQRQRVGRGSQRAGSAKLQDAGREGAGKVKVEMEAEKVKVGVEVAAVM